MICRASKRRCEETGKERVEIAARSFCVYASCMRRCVALPILRGVTSCDDDRRKAMGFRVRRTLTRYLRLSWVLE